MISVSALPLLAYKVGPNLFDISSNLHHVSIRDQIHRAVALAEALVAGNQFRASRQVLIVGAGVSGVVAGMVLARHDLEVQIVDASLQAPFRLQRNVETRYVGPYMYEWPLPVFDNQAIPPLNGPLFNWANGKPTSLTFHGTFPVPPKNLVNNWEATLKKAIADSHGRLRLQVGINSSATNGQVKHWLHATRRKKTRNVTIFGGEPWGGSLQPRGRFVPQFVLLAAGMGSEKTTLKLGHGAQLGGQDFWSNDQIREPNCGLSPAPRVVVIGGGDGALQDALRASTIDDHPLDTWQRISDADSNGVLPPALAELQTMEAQHALNTIWKSPTALQSAEVPVLDAAYQLLAERLAGDLHVRRAAVSSLRKDVHSVHLCIKDGWFSKAYALNRFLVHLLEQCSLKTFGPNGALVLSVVRNVELIAVSPQGDTRELTFSNGMVLFAELVVVRLGADRDGLPGQWLGLTSKDTVNRQELARVPLPLYLPPSL